MVFFTQSTNIKQAIVYLPLYLRKEPGIVAYEVKLPVLEDFVSATHTTKNIPTISRWKH